MALKFLADEHIDSRVISALQSHGFAVRPARQFGIGLSDRELLQIARTENAIIITEDKDFGEWLFAHHETAVGIVFLRYKASELAEIQTALSSVLAKPDSLIASFTTVTARKIRRRHL